MTVLSKYLAKQIYIAFFCSLLAFVALFIFFDFLSEIKNIGKANYSTWLAFAHVSLQVPDRFYEFSPIAALIAGVFVLSKLSVKSEFVIFRTYGMNPFRLLSILFFISIPIVISIFLLGEFISPFTEKISQTIRIKALGEETTKLKSGIWLKNDNAIQKEFIRIGKQNNNELENVYIYKFSNNFKLNQILYSKNISVNKNLWSMKNITEIDFNTSLINQKLYDIKHYDRSVVNININPLFFNITLLEPQQLSITALYKYINYLKINKQISSTYEQAFAKKLIYPFSCILMLFICIPFAYLHARSSGIGIKMFLGIMIGLSFYLSYTLFSQLGNLGSLSIWSTQIIPFLLYVILGIISYIIISKKG